MGVRGASSGVSDKGKKYDNGYDVKFSDNGPNRI